MSPVKQWPIRRPRRIAVLDTTLYAGAATAIGYCLFSYSLYIVPIALLLVLWFFWRQRRFRTSCPNAQLCFRESGWEIKKPGAVRSLVLTHAWPAFAWVTLRFRDLAGTGRKETMLELTIWKSSVPPDAWRQLCVIVAGEQAATLRIGGRDA